MKEFSSKCEILTGEILNKNFIFCPVSRKMFITEYMTVLETNLTLILRKRKVKQT